MLEQALAHFPSASLFVKAYTSWPWCQQSSVPASTHDTPRWSAGRPPVGTGYSRLETKQRLLPSGDQNG